MTRNDLLWWRIRHWKPVRVIFIEYCPIRPDFALVKELETLKERTVAVEDLYEHDL